MTVGNGRPLRFRVELLQQARQVVEALGRRAKEAGTFEKFAAAMEFIAWRLETNPLGFGEPTHHLWHLGMVVHVGASKPVIVHFGIHPEKRFVVVQSVAMLPG